MFENVKIYKLTIPTSDKIYIGSTQHELRHRLNCHKNYYNSFLNGKVRYISSIELFKLNNNVNIELVELFNANYKWEILEKERHYINTIECVNIVKRPFVSVDEKKIDRSIYGRNKYMENREKMKKICLDNYYKKKYIKSIINISNSENETEIEIDDV
jgi:hypothetical protein